MKNWKLISEVSNLPIGVHTVKDKDGNESEAHRVVMANGSTAWMNGKNGSPVRVHVEEEKAVVAPKKAVIEDEDVAPVKASVKKKK